jgi:hypothetical protein
MYNEEELIQPSDEGNKGLTECKYVACGRGARREGYDGQPLQIFLRGLKFSGHF